MSDPYLFVGRRCLTAMHLFPALGWEELWRLPVDVLLGVARAVDDYTAEARRSS